MVYNNGCKIVNKFLSGGTFGDGVGGHVQAMERKMNHCVQFSSRKGHEMESLQVNT